MYVHVETTEIFYATSRLQKNAAQKNKNNNHTLINQMGCNQTLQPTNQTGQTGQTIISEVKNSGLI